MTSWSAVLDELEARIDAHRAVLSGASAVAPYALPSDIGPLPIELVGRACVILARQREVEEEIESEMASLRSFFREPTATSAAVPIYLDQRA